MDPHEAVLVGSDTDVQRALEYSADPRFSNGAFMSTLIEECVSQGRDFSLITVLDCAWRNSTVFAPGGLTRAMLSACRKVSTLSIMLFDSRMAGATGLAECLHHYPQHSRLLVQYMSPLGAHQVDSSEKSITCPMQMLFAQYMTNQTMSDAVRIYDSICFMPPECHVDFIAECVRMFGGITYPKLIHILITSREIPRAVIVRYDQIVHMFRRNTPPPVVDANTLQHVGRGTYGVCIRGLSCARPAVDRAVCGKITTVPHASRELELSKTFGLRAIDPWFTIFLYPHQSCTMQSSIMAHNQPDFRTPGGSDMDVILQSLYGGQTLRSILNESSFRRDELLDAMCAILFGIHLMSLSGFYHMDIKPDNIVGRVSTHDGRRSISLRIIDFGMAVRASDLRANNVYLSGYLWPFEVSFLSRTRLPLAERMSMFRRKSNSPARVIADYDDHLCAALGSRFGGCMSSGGAASLLELLRGVDRFQIGLVLADKRLLGLDHHVVQSLLHVDPAKRMTPLEAMSQLRTVVSNLQR